MPGSALAVTGPQTPAASSRWAAVPIAAALAFSVSLTVVLWQTPFPLSESVGLFEDVAVRPVSGFLLPSINYYRPLFHVSLSALWNLAPSLESALASIKIALHIVPAAALLLLFAMHLRPRTAMQAAAALVALAALGGAPGLLGNLELALSITIVGMPLAVAAWMLLERPHSAPGDVGIVACLIVATGFKEHGLVIAPLIVIAWWMGAPGDGRATAATAFVFALAYVVFRLALRQDDLPMFEQMIGYGFEVVWPADAATRWGHFPLGIYLYNACATISQILFAEPTEGVFRVVQAASEGRLRPWQLVHVGSSTASTVLVIWWGVRELRACRTRPWSADARMFMAAVVAVAACGALSFAYSRDRLGGMAVPFYALAVYGAVTAALERAVRMRSSLAAGLVTAALVVVSAGWSLRAIYTIEFTRQRAVNNQREWLTDLGERRERLRGREEYLRIMDAMQPQGTEPHGIRRTPYPRWFYRLLGEY